MRKLGWIILIFTHVKLCLANATHKWVKNIYIGLYVKFIYALYMLIIITLNKLGPNNKYILYYIYYIDNLQRACMQF